MFTSDLSVPLWSDSDFMRTDGMPRCMQSRPREQGSRVRGIRAVHHLRRRPTPSKRVGWELKGCEVAALAENLTRHGEKATTFMITNSSLCIAFCLSPVGKCKWNVMRTHDKVYLYICPFSSLTVMISSFQISSIQGIQQTFHKFPQLCR